MAISNPAGWPEEVLPIFARAVTCEYASLARDGGPVTWPLNPYIGEDGRTLDVSTGLTYPSKAERARRNPHVALLFSDPVGSGLKDPPVVLVQGMATVRDSNLQANTDRYLNLSIRRFPAAFKGRPRVVVRMQRWYWTRIWILVTPLRILWWPGSHTDEVPQCWEAPPGTVALPSDPAPRGRAPGPWQPEPASWKEAAQHAARDLGAPVLTVVGHDGYPCPFRANAAVFEENGFRLEIPAGMPTAPVGPACLTFHTHAEVFAGQENVTFRGHAKAMEGGAIFRVEKLLPDFSLPGSWLSSGLTFMDAARRLAPRLKPEAARRGQPVPAIHLP